jgi:hypothetical protein
MNSSLLSDRSDFFQNQTGFEYLFQVNISLAEKRNESINKLLDGAGENSDAVFVS